MSGFNLGSELRAIATETLKPAERFDLAKAMLKYEASVAAGKENLHIVAHDPTAPMYLRIWALEEIEKRGGL